MRSYIVLTSAKPDKGFNRAVSVYRVKNNTPEFIGADYRIESGATLGDRAVAANIIARVENVKMKDEFYLVTPVNLHVL